MQDFFKDYKELSPSEFFVSHQFYEVCREAAYKWDEMRPTWRKRLWWRLTRNIGPTSAFRRRLTWITDRITLNRTTRRD